MNIKGIEVSQVAIDYFWNGVDKSGECWLYSKTTWANRYAKVGIRHQGKSATIGAHKFAYITAVGPVADGMYVCHHCDEPKCVRPEHLFLGTPKQNAEDCIRKGRRPRGEARSISKLTNEKVREIREMSEAGMTQMEISREVGVHQTTVSRVLLGATWKHV